jgi:hypothetical protein
MDLGRAGMRGFVALYLGAEHLGNRWWKALPPAIRERGLIRWLADRRKP